MEDYEDKNTSPPSCAKELRTCPDGSSVGRNPIRNCVFDPCPRFNINETEEDKDNENNDDEAIYDTSMSGENQCIDEGGAVETYFDSGSGIQCPAEERFIKRVPFGVEGGILCCKKSGARYNATQSGRMNNTRMNNSSY